MSELVPSESLIAPLLAAVPGGIVQVSAAGAIVRANPAAIEFLGLSFDELSRRYTQDFEKETLREDGSVCPVDEYPITIALTKHESAGPTTIGVRTPTGVRWAVFRAQPVVGGGAVATFLDITEWRAAEHRLRASDRLASLGRLAAGVAHEINNPLTWVLLNLERAELGQEPEESLALAREGVERVAAIVRDLGTFSQVEEEELEPVCIANVLKQALSMASTQLGHRAELRIVEAPDLWALASANRVVQIVVNLLVNAAQSIEPGRRAENLITVTTRSTADHRVRIEIEDTGAGMAEDTLQHALDPFFTTKAPGAGSGLGLAISSGLATAMGATIELESTLHQGTTAALSLKRSDPTSVESAPPTQPQIVTPARVLVIDDEPEIGAMMAWALQPHRVEVEPDGARGLEHLARQRPDVVFVDLMMPEVTGLEVYERVVQEYPDLVDRLIFITGGTYTEEARQFAARPDITCVAKPFRAEVLRSLVQRLLETRNQP